MLPKSPNTRNLDHTKTYRGPQREIKILIIPPSKKTFEGESYSSAGSEATVGYQYQGYVKEES